MSRRGRQRRTKTGWLLLVSVPATRRLISSAILLQVAAGAATTITTTLALKALGVPGSAVLSILGTILSVGTALPLSRRVGRLSHSKLLVGAGIQHLAGSGLIALTALVIPHAGRGAAVGLLVGCALWNCFSFLSLTSTIRAWWTRLEPGGETSVLAATGLAANPVISAASWYLGPVLGALGLSVLGPATLVPVAGIGVLGVYLMRRLPAMETLAPAARGGGMHSFGGPLGRVAVGYGMYQASRGALGMACGAFALERDALAWYGSLVAAPSLGNLLGGVIVTGMMHRLHRRTNWSRHFLLTGMLAQAPVLAVLMVVPREPVVWLAVLIIAGTVKAPAPAGAHEYAARLAPGKDRRITAATIGTAMTAGTGAGTAFGLTGSLTVLLGASVALLVVGAVLVASCPKVKQAD